MTNDELGELWSEISRGLRPNIAQEWTIDHGATLQKIVDVVATTYRCNQAIQQIQRIIENDILKPCIEYESAPGAFESDIPPNDKGARL